MIHLVLVMPEKRLFEGNVDSLKLPGVEGQLGVHPHHMPLITMLQEGELIARQSDEVYYFALHGGFAQITNTEVIVLASLAERAEEIDIQRAEAAHKRAEERLHAADLTTEEHEQLLLRLQRAETRLRIASKKRLSAPPKYGQE